ncbi:beta-ketoacyl synthase N-terminal-like domain-containing protein [Massilia sp. DJPM01]|uniref:beta-ketoacyl synthase N-terminal-like domain-containing protein n=1 Tax=Massilia sp. DJPM01 TaxID=3024404 RepID=UPI00259DB7B7|nr:beta-ketoacyl synthase N-terminal-like domain-containing protein [Massilia sp. DJPM01]
MRQVYISGAAAVSAFGFDWRGLAGHAGFAGSRQLAASHGEVMASEVPPIPADIDVDARARKLMAHPARLAAVALRLALDDARWTAAQREQAALYLGVGASGCSMSELTRMLAASIADHAFSLERFGGAGLAACNPLFAFQLMNNFTLCHGAILNGTGGPNGAFYSRGTGTVAALAEAHWLVHSGECGTALAGGGDSALHPVTWTQLDAAGYPARGLVPAEGAGLLALSACADGALATLDAVSFHSARAWERNADLLLNEARDDALVVLAPWGSEARSRHGNRDALDVSLSLGDALAAAPALAWCVALDLIRTGRCRRAVVFSSGIDGGLGIARFGSVA